MQTDLEYLFEQLINAIVENMQERLLSIHNDIGVYQSFHFSF